MRALLLASVIALAATEVLAASGTGTVAADRWRRSDECAKKSFEIYPDFTKEHAAKRDAFVRKCLAENRLPARDGVAPKN